MRGRRLLQGIVDYAGLFPPSALSMEDAVAEYATQRVSAEAFMLAAFVVPVGRLVELQTVREARGATGRWPISALLASDPEADARTLLDFVGARGSELELVAVEFRPGSP